MVMGNRGHPPADRTGVKYRPAFNRKYNDSSCRRDMKIKNIKEKILFS